VGAACLMETACILSISGARASLMSLCLSKSLMPLNLGDLIRSSNEAPGEWREEREQ
jgi:hypothetical protein